MGKRLLALIGVLALLWGSAPAESGISSKEDLNRAGRRIGISQGSAAEAIVRSELPEADIVYFTDNLLGYTSVAQGKTDAYVFDRTQMQLAVDSGLTGVRLLPETMDETVRIAVGYSDRSRIPNLKDRLNGFIAEAKADGTLDDMRRRWVLERNYAMPEIPPAENPLERLTVGTTGSVPPYSYYEDGRLTGYDIELAHRFAAWLGAELSFGIYDFDGIIPAAKAGKVDVVMSNLQYRPERAEELSFSDILYEEKMGILVRDQGGAAPETDVSGGAGRQGRPFSALSELNGKRIGVQTGTTFDRIVLDALPEAKISYFNSYPDLAAALEANKIDGFPGDEPVLRMMAAENGRLTVLDEYMDSFEFAFVTPKTEAGGKLLAEIDDWLTEFRAGGGLDEVISKWTSGAEADRVMPDYAAFPAPNGKLVLATEGAYAPMNYFRGSEAVGFEIDLAARFCEAKGYGLSVKTMNFDGILPAVQTGKADFAAAGITVTDERRESVNFSIPYYTGGTAMAVLNTRDEETGQAASGVRWQDYNGKRLGVLVGPLMEEAAGKFFPDSETMLLDSYPDCVTALLGGKIDAFLGDEPELRMLHTEQPEISYIPERLTQNNYCFAFRKNDPKSAALCAELNGFLARCREDGTMRELEDIWFGADEDRKVVDTSDLTGENGIIRVVTTSTDMPFSYIKEGKNVGYDIDLTVRFCRDRGYALELGDVDFAARIPAVQYGKYDFSTDMNATPERAEQVLFSDPTSYGGIVLAVMTRDLDAAKEADLSDGTAESVSFLDGVRDSFNKTFIRENRWKLFVQGILTTLLITALTILSGTVLGFAVFMLCRNGNPAANAVTRFCVWLVQGMPMVVLLMILFYIIFGSVAVSGVLVAVIGFTLTFGAAVFGLLKMGVGAVDRGQYEAAYALGYSSRRTFFRIILPQALPHVLPAYRGEIVSLIKATAIVGYIAVQDLTKMGDIVRSRTYEAFFPLIAITVIYFVLEGLIGFLIGRIGAGFNPRRRKPADILKGVKTDDQD